MKDFDDKEQYEPEWFAIRTPHASRAAELLVEHCEDLFYPLETVLSQSGRKAIRPVIPHVLFIKTSHLNILEMEKSGRENPDINLPFWIYRYPNENRIRPIAESSIELLRLLTADDPSRCEIFHKNEFRTDQRVRVTAGQFKGYEGYVQRVHKNRHVVVKIEGICMVMLPFIHPDLLHPLE